MFRIGKSIQTESRLVVAGGWEVGSLRMVVTAHECRVYFRGDENVLELGLNSFVNTLKTLKTTELYTLNG